MVFKHMRIAAAAGVAGVIAAGFALATPLAPTMGAAAAQEATGQLLVLRVNGERRWRVQCTLEKDNGRVTEPSARGRGSRSSGSVVGRGVLTGACEVTADQAGPVEIALDDRAAAFACPFDVDASGACERLFAAGSTESFEIALAGG